MALIVIQHNVVDNFDVDPAYSVAINGRLIAGTIVGLNSSGFVAHAQDTALGVLPLGIAGDSISDEYKTTAYAADLVINPKGGKRWTSNRVSDFYNETLASSLMTVYIGSGRFATDQYLVSDTWTGSYGAKVYPNGQGLFTLGNNGAAARSCGYVVAPPSAYPSGVPGVDSPSVLNSMSLGTFLTVHLSI